MSLCARLRPLCRPHRVPGDPAPELTAGRSLGSEIDHSLPPKGSELLGFFLFETLKYTFNYSLGQEEIKIEIFILN